MRGGAVKIRGSEGGTRQEHHPLGVFSTVLSTRKDACFTLAVCSCQLKAHVQSVRLKGGDQSTRPVRRSETLAWGSAQQGAGVRLSLASSQRFGGDLVDCGINVHPSKIHQCGLEGGNPQPPFAPADTPPILRGNL